MAVTHHPFPPVRPAKRYRTRRLRNLTSIQGKPLCSTMTILCTSYNPLFLRRIALLRVRIRDSMDCYSHVGERGRRVERGNTPHFYRGSDRQVPSLRPPMPNPSPKSLTHATSCFFLLHPQLN